MADYKCQITTKAGLHHVSVKPEGVGQFAQAVLNCMKSGETLTWNDEKGTLHGACRGSEIIGFYFFVPLATSVLEQAQMDYYKANARYYEQQTEQESWKRPKEGED